MYVVKLHLKGCGEAVERDEISLLKQGTIIPPHYLMTTMALKELHYMDRKKQVHIQWAYSIALFLSN